jgi:uncharacterized RDD family membrane protein YckC
MNPNDAPVATLPSQTDERLAEVDPPTDGGMNVNVVGRRLLAFVVDTCITFVVISVAAAAFGLPERLDTLALILGFFAYKIIGERLRGMTIGKRILSVTVIDRSGRPIGWIAAITRNLMLIPGAWFLFIPSLAMMEFSPSKQRLGDRIAGTVVVRARNRTLPASDFDPTTVQPMVPSAQAESPVVLAQSPLRAENWRVLVAGSLALAATTIVATTILTIDLTLCSQIGMRNCDGDFGSPVWAGSETAHTLAFVSATFALVAIPLCIGGMARRWVWIPGSGCVWGVGFVIGMILGYWIVDRSYVAYTSELTDNAGAGPFYFLILIIGWPIPAIFALLGVLGGMGIVRLRR